ncbi:PREDICTED: uncharacterized protein LOC109193230, partial [Ipomoea nil]|uniref:uncharacterized protein LOC109193230 n=1 Tax=Ipomoea nil TaxID=35883 RepID=UPI000900A501
MGGKIDRNVNSNGGPPIFRINGQNFHYIGTLFSVDGKKPHFAQLYIYDTNNEIGQPCQFCNPKWPEVQRFLNTRKLRPEDRPDIICRIFKLKLDALLSECRKNKLFGPVIGVIYTIEFQKRGLPHAHILLFLNKNNRAQSGINLDNIILAELPDQETDPEYFKSRSIKYLFKYVNKGHDRVTAEFFKANCDAECPKVIDEISMFYDFWYISPCEASWRLFGFDIQLRTPAVERLSFHLPNQQSGVFADDDPVDNILSRPTIMFLEWFEANKTYPAARQLTYAEMPTKFVWKKDVRKWDACSARGLVDGDREYVHAIEEESQWATGVNLRILFVTLLMSNSMGKPEVVWEAAWHYLAEDAQFKISAQLGITDLILSEDEKKNFALHEIQIMFSAMGKSLKDFLLMPNDKLVHQLTEEQRAIYGEVLQDAENNLGGLFFVYGYGGMGKTFLWRALSSALRSKGDIVLNVASSGIASLLLPGGRTAHSRFSIPIAVNEDSTCNISQSSPLAQLIMQSGDFRQILPVIPKGTRQDIVGASINASYLWRSCKVFRLTKNLRLRSLQSDTEVKEIEKFAKWIANIGDGTIGDCLHGEYRAILTPTLDIVDAVNEYMNDYNNAEGRTYLSCDSVCKSNSNVDMLPDLHTAEFFKWFK